MKHFIYTIHKKWPRNQGYADCTVRLYVIKRGEPVFLKERPYNHEDDFQAAYITAEQCKALPRKYFERHPLSNSCVWHSLSLKEAKVASFHNLSHD